MSTTPPPFPYAYWSTPPADPTDPVVEVIIPGLAVPFGGGEILGTPTDPYGWGTAFTVPPWATKDSFTLVAAKWIWAFRPLADSAPGMQHLDAFVGAATSGNMQLALLRGPAGDFLPTTVVATTGSVAAPAINTLAHLATDVPFTVNHSTDWIAICADNAVAQFEGVNAAALTGLHNLAAISFGNANFPFTGADLAGLAGRMSLPTPLLMASV